MKFGSGIELTGVGGQHPITSPFFPTPLWPWNPADCLLLAPSSIRFVGKPEGVSNVFLTYFDYFSGGQYKFRGWETPEGVLTPPPPTPDKSSTDPLQPSSFVTIRTFGEPLYTAVWWINKLGRCILIRLLNRKWQTAHVYNQSASYTKYGPPAHHAG